MHASAPSHWDNCELWPRLSVFWKLGTRFKFNKHALSFIFWSLRKAVNTAVHRRGLFLYPSSNAELHHWQLLLCMASKPYTSSATTWFLFPNLSNKNILQNTRRKPYKAMMHCICASSPSQDLSFSPWKDKEWFEIVFEISVLIAHVPHIGGRKVLSFLLLYHTPSKFNNVTQIIVVILQNFFYLDNQLFWWSLDSMLSIPICCFVCLLITPTSLLRGSPAEELPAYSIYCVLVGSTRELPSCDS